jgi:electron transport complex protein RnfC
MLLTKLFSKRQTFNGGLHLDPHKRESTRQPVRSALLPKQLILPLQQHIGVAAKPIVAVGEHVFKGQILAKADGYISAYIHAPSSGTISALEERPIAHPSGLSAPCFVIDTDDQDQWGKLPPPLTDYLTVASIELRRRVREAGIVGLGGAAFPSAVKLSAGSDGPINLLILNGAECEPYITCDDMLMRQRAEDIISGLLIMRHTLQANTAIIAVEDNKPEAYKALAEALKGFDTKTAGIELRQVPTQYPVGGEKQLIKVLTGHEVPSQGIPPEIGIVCHNVGTAVAVYEAIVKGRPLLSRYVTVTGQGVRQPQVLEVLIGTPVAQLIEQCGGYTGNVERLIMGGPMMGFALHTDQLPVTKGSNCLLVASPMELTPPTPAMPCIRCGACADVCPANLLPQQLYWYARAKDFDKIQDHHLFDCIECGCCASVCPSHIPLVQYYRFAKTEIWTQERDRQKADRARQRHAFHEIRLAQEKQAKEAKLRKKKAALQHASDGKDPLKSAVAAAVARAKAKSQGAIASPTGEKDLPHPSPPAATTHADSATSDT